MTIYRRKLPHIQPIDGCFFVTFMLKGALPRKKVDQLLKLNHAIQDGNQHVIDAVPFSNLGQIPWNRYIASFSHLLCGEAESPRWLENESVADVIVKSIHFLGEDQMRVLAWCIMPNHVHLLMDDLKAPLHLVLQRMKRHTARECNRILGRTGQSFWQDESFDHLLRKEEQILEKVNYILMNPVRAGLVGQNGDWKYSGIHPQLKDDYHKLFQS